MEKITTVECQLNEFLPELQSLISGHFQSGEAILFSCQTLHQGSPFIKEPNAYGQIITERRVALAVHNKFIDIAYAPSDFISNAGYASGIKQQGNGNFAGSILLSDIVSLETNSIRMNCSRVKTTGLGGNDLQFVFASNEIHQNFLNILQKAMDNAKTAISHSGINIEKRLEELTRLYKNGLISEIEYESKRKEILNQL
jgi:hypothetical protein